MGFDLLCRYNGERAILQTLHILEVLQIAHSRLVSFLLAREIIKQFD
nr:MAG TPA_asm: hypothetical protein [Caudoviricetes sp.]